MTINKSDIIDKMADKTGLTKADAGRALDEFVEIVKASLKKGNDIAIAGFGSFDVVSRKAREGRNPQTGEKIKIKASKSPRFRPGKALKDAVNKR